MAQSFATQKQKLSDSPSGEPAPTTYCLDGNGFAKPVMGSIAVSRVDGVDNDYYYLAIAGDAGHHLTAILEVGTFPRAQVPCHSQGAQRTSSHARVAADTRTYKGT